MGGVNSYTFERGEVVNQKYFFSDGSDDGSLTICKKESADLSYRVSVAFEGIDFRDFGDRVGLFPRWSLSINDKIPMSDEGPLTYYASIAFTIKPLGKNYIIIQEKDHTGLDALWVDISNENYPVYDTCPYVSAKIEALVEKGKFFKPFDDMIVKKIFYSSGVGVLLYARENMGNNAAIYYANEDAEEFSKCQSTMVSQCRCPSGDSTWEVTVPNEEEGNTHTLFFTKGETEGCHGKEPSWDGVKLASLVLN